MALLHIALQEGFDGDTVGIRVNGKQVFQKSGVSTRRQINKADAFDVEVGEQEASVAVSVTAKGREAQITVNAAEEKYLGIFIGLDGCITFRPSSRPFGYV